MVVDDIPYSCRDGEDVVFDATNLQYPANATTRDSIILSCDIERPMKYRWAQRLMNAVGGFLMRAAASPNGIGQCTGGLIRAFYHIYAIRRVGKALKTWNRTACYVVNWCLLARHRAAHFWH